MNDTISRFFQRLEGKNIYFVGIGVTNTDTVAQFARRGLRVTACDKRTRAQIGEGACTSLEAAGARLLLGPDYPTELGEADVLFRTPGMYYNQPELVRYRAGGGLLTSEMEVFCALCPCPLYAVTGSDGKTTTATLIAEMLRAQGKTVHLGGNIGRALLPIIEEISPDDRAVVELSSFQLISMRCAPQVSVVTNVTPNHLDVHGSMEEYTDAKRNIFLHQDAFSTTVLGADNEASASFAPQVRGRCVTFSLEGPVRDGAYYSASDHGIYVADRRGGITRLMDAREIRLRGIHNVANYLAAVCAVRGEVDAESIRKVAREFGGVEHRIEFVRELDGVQWYNDSIATSPTRAIAGLRAFDGRIVMIAGGYDKKIPFEPLAPEIVERVKVLILCGATADKIQSAVMAAPGYKEGHPQILRARNIPDAVGIARGVAQSGDVVSLSPACASFDSYPNFEARGRHFKELINDLQ